MARVSRIAASASLMLLKSVADGLTPGDRSYLARQLMRDRFGPKTRALGDLFNKSIHAWKNKQYRVRENGEGELLRRLAPFNPEILFDVGANVGHWTNAACMHLSDTRVHAFEIAPPTAESFAVNTAQFSHRVQLNTVGLGNSEGEITLFFTPESNTATTTVEGVAEISAQDHGIHTIEKLKAKITTGDQYMRAHGVSHIDFLKIDVEGAEWDVLQGFSGAFADRKIDMVQFEYGPLSLKTRVLLEDFWKFFDQNGFEVGKLYPEGVAFKHFEYSDEDFVGPNFVAVHKSRRDLIEHLRCEVL
ncbi:MAG TPA: FkbM family methyltransferase [Rhizomicrobium sp.]|nr:FkbM family methyltransferase [Rhizomicrobium sp.]